MVNKVSNLEKQSLRNVSKAKAECEEAIKRHQAFIDQVRPCTLLSETAQTAPVRRRATC